MTEKVVQLISELTYLKLRQFSSNLFLKCFFAPKAKTAWKNHMPF